MANRGDRRKVFVVGIGEYGAVVQQPGESAFVIAPKSGQVIVTELIDHNGKNKFRLLRRDSGERAGKKYTEREYGRNAFHGRALIRGSERLCPESGRWLRRLL